MIEQLKTEVEESPPSAKLVFKVLQVEGDLTQKEIVDHTLMPSRTVRYALTELEERDVVQKRFSFVDARQRVYSLTCQSLSDAEIVAD